MTLLHRIKIVATVGRYLPGYDVRECVDGILSLSQIIGPEEEARINVRRNQDDAIEVAVQVIHRTSAGQILYIQEVAADQYYDYGIDIEAVVSKATQALKRASLELGA